MVVSLPMGIPRGLYLDIRKSSSHALTNETTTCPSRLCPVVRPQRVVMVRATLADNMASRVGRARYRLLRRVSLVPDPEQPSAQQVRAVLGYSRH